MKTFAKTGTGLALAATIMFAATGCASTPSQPSAGVSAAVETAVANPSEAATQTAPAVSDENQIAQRLNDFYEVILSDENATVVANQKLDFSKEPTSEDLAKIEKDFAPISEHVYRDTLESETDRVGLIYGFGLIGTLMAKAGLESLTVAPSAVTVNGENATVDMSKSTVEGTESITKAMRESKDAQNTFAMIKVNGEWKIDGKTTFELGQQ